MKQRINILISEDTAERLKMYAWENHKTVSQAITDRSWTAKVKNAQVRGQTTLADRMKKQETAAAGRCPGRPASEFFCDSKKNRIVTALQNRTVTAHEINNNMRTGWIYVNGEWYFMNKDGAMCTNQWIDGIYYCELLEELTLVPKMHILSHL